MQQNGNQQRPITMSAFKEPPKKSLGQHFLTDRSIIEKIVLAVKPQADDFLVEIGPGQGAITFPLLKKHGALTVIEFDRDLITPLMESAEGIGELTIIHKDVLKVDFSKLAADRPAIRLVGNLPYNISTPILFHVLEHAQSVRDMHFMLQKEVIDRMAAEPGSKVYGRLSVMLQARCEVTPLFLVPPSAFNPPPKVDSAVVRLQPLPADKIKINDPTLFENLVRDAFGQRRKTIRNAMQAICSSEDIEAVGLRPDLRAEQVPVADFVNLANFCATKKATNP
jgi:16S rRNA (adenine1518-N6/adenine1519-N6)-dimethyltransferase